MLFNSFSFLAFLAVFLILYYRLTHRGQNFLILVASYFFYAAWDWRFLILLAFTTYVDYFVARRMEIETNAKSRRTLLGVSLVCNLGMLGFFKYFDFFAVNLQGLLKAIGFNVELPLLNLILPVGISFYTLHSLGYVLDVYSRRQPPVKSALEFGCFVSFFPLLVAGPILRIATMRKQFSESCPMVVHKAQIESGVCLILIGYFQKIVIADNLGVFVDRCFSDPKLHSAADLLLGVYAFAYQIYCDFAGYSNIAIGLSLCLGFILPANFDRPYFAFGIREFWRRWHISLSSWLRDYLYIPLGGSRKGDTNRNLLLTMGICGLWHGASWNMLLWGIYHGAAMVAQRTLGALIPAHTIAKLSGSVWGRAFGTLLTFHIVCAGWMLFRAPSLLHAQTYVLSLFKSDWALSTAAPIALALIATAVAIDILHGAYERQDFPSAWPIFARGIGLGIVFVALTVVGGFSNAPFIYFQF